MSGNQTLYYKYGISHKCCDILQLFIFLKAFIAVVLITKVCQQHMGLLSDIWL